MVMATSPGVADVTSRQDIFKIWAAAVDQDGWDIPLRQGQNVAPVFGIAHGGIKHGISSPPNITAVIQLGAKDLERGPENPTYRLEAYNTDDPEQRETVVVGAFTGNILEPIGPTPDGRAVGLITAYCQGKERCPGWVDRPPDAITFKKPGSVSSPKTADELQQVRT